MILYLFPLRNSTIISGCNRGGNQGLVDYGGNVRFNRENSSLPSLLLAAMLLALSAENISRLFDIFQLLPLKVPYRSGIIFP
jgi:hypothetical protein